MEVQQWPMDAYRVLLGCEVPWLQRTLRRGARAAAPSSSQVALAPATERFRPADTHAPHVTYGTRRAILPSPQPPLALRPLAPACSISTRPSSQLPLPANKPLQPFTPLHTTLRHTCLPSALSTPPVQIVSQDAGSLRVAAPPGPPALAGVAPPGRYMLFLVGQRGTYSTAVWVTVQ